MFDIELNHSLLCVLIESFTHTEDEEGIMNESMNQSVLISIHWITLYDTSEETFQCWASWITHWNMSLLNLAYKHTHTHTHTHFQYWASWITHSCVYNEWINQSVLISIHWITLYLTSESISILSCFDYLNHLDHLLTLTEIARHWIIWITRAYSHFWITNHSYK